MASAVIRRFADDEMKGDLWVEFTTGRRYVYSGVPRDVADAFRGAFARGVYFNSRIRDQFVYREVTSEKATTES